MELGFHWTDLHETVWWSIFEICSAAVYAPFSRVSRRTTLQLLSSPRTLLVPGGLWVYGTFLLELGSDTSLLFEG
jgi:hypothetical protein